MNTEEVYVPMSVANQMCLDSVASYAKRNAELEEALRKIIDRAEYRMSHKVIDDIVDIARKTIETSPTRPL